MIDVRKESRRAANEREWPRMVVPLSFLLLLVAPSGLWAAPSVGTPVVIPSTVVVGQATPLTATCQVTTAQGDPAVLAGGVNLVRLTAAGADASVLGVMTAGANGSYSYSFTDTEAATGQYGLQCVAAFAATVRRVRSTAATVTAVTSLPPITLTSLSTIPASPVPGQQFALTISGSNFDPSSAVIVINGPACAPCTVSNGALTAKTATSVTGPVTLGAGSFTVAVQNVATAATSGTLALTVAAVPSLTSLSTVPAAPVAGQQFALTISGTNFDPASALIVINGPGCAPCTVSNGALTAKTATSVTGPVTLAAGSFTVAVQNAATAATSGTLPLTVAAAPPSLTSLSTVPAAPVPGQQFSLTVLGASFDPTSAQIVINGPGCAPCAITNAALTSKTATSLTGPITIASSGTFTVAVQNVSSGATSGTLALTVAAAGAPTITSFAPQSGSVGTMVTINGSNFGAAPQVTMPSLNGGVSAPIAVPLQSMSATSVVVVIPSGAVTGPITVSNSVSSAATASPFTVNAPNTFSLSASPASAILIQGQSVAYSVQLASTNGFNQLAPLTVAGLPAGVTASFAPSSITAGQTSVLTLTAPANQALVNVSLLIMATATVLGIPQAQSATTALAITAPTTTLLGRTVVSDALQTPLAGVTIATLGQDGNGNSTGCVNHTTVSDPAGNFQLTNLPAQCTGPQLISFDGSTATSPAGKYDGVHLAFTLASGQVTPAPVLVHLPRIDTAETFYVQQNAATNQTHSFSSIPGVSVTVYAGTTLTLPDGTQPNPFPISVVSVLPDRLPDQKPVVPTMIGAFYLSFQPTGTHTSQPMAITYPNVLNTPPGTDMPLMVLDATHGSFTPIGTGKVSADGSVIVPDPDPAHPGHAHGIINFDW